MFHMRINPKQMEKAMKRMGIQSQDIDAEEVIIRTAQKEIIIANPQVSRINMMGQDTFQVSGEVSEKSRARFSEEDIRLIMQRTGADRAKVMQVLEDTDDMAETIMKLKKS